MDEPSGVVQPEGTDDTPKCDVTGEPVRPEAAVRFQGRTLSAEGKRLLFDQFEAGNSIRQWAVDRPGVIRRWLCSAADGVLINLVSTFIVAPFLAYTNLDSYRWRLNTAPIGMLTTIVVVGINILYFAGMHARWGQTIGKMVGGYKVVNMDGSPPSFTVCLNRAFWFAGVNLATLLLFIPGDAVVLSGIVTLFTSVYPLVDGIVLVADSQWHRSLHDRIAGTRVVFTRST